MSRFVTRSSLSAVRALGPEAERSHARVSAIIARHVSPRHAQLLAEPVPVRDGTGVDWYFEGEGEVLSLANLPADEAAAVKARLAAMTDEVLAAATRIESDQRPAQRHIPPLLRNAMQFPGGDSIWAVRDGDAWRPLLVEWGYEAHDAPAAAPFHVSTFAEPPPEAPTSAAAQEPPPPVPPTVGTDRAGGQAGAVLHSAPVLVAGHRGGWLAALLWSLLFLLIFALIVAFLLPACGLRTPFGTIVFGLPSGSACHPQTTAAQDPMVTAVTLERELQVLREEFLRRQSTCLLEPEQPSRAAEAELPAFEDVIDERGEYQVTLIWNTTDDLDLHIRCPSGEHINHLQKVACGGELDEDDNNNPASMTESPVENITFEGGPGAGGTFQILVDRYKTNDSGATSVPYRVRVRTPEGTREYDGSITVIGNGRPEPVTTVQW